MRRAARLTDISPVSSRPITALEWMLGGNSWVVGAPKTEPSRAGCARRSATASRDGAGAHLRAAGRAGRGPGAVGRERSFATVGRDGDIVLRHQTSERVLATLPPRRPVSAVLITPKADALLTLEERCAPALRPVQSRIPRSAGRRCSARSGTKATRRPEYVWQSTGATDDIEPKFSLVPLIFGTIKGTLYAMLFAVPLAVLAALYTSQFADPALRAKIKPTVEIMAALPSVVIGFLAGLYLASVVERNLVAVLLMMPLMPLVRHVRRAALAAAARSA